MTKEEATEKAVKSVLGKSGQMTLAGVCRDVSELRSFLSRKEARAVIIDIDPDPSQVLFELRTVLTAYPSVYMAVLCSSFTKELVLQAMQAGARHFLEKASIESELSKELQSLIHDGAKKGPTPGSQIISIFSAGGGCGATTVAVNLANELRLSSSRPVLVIDLDTCYGAVSTYLGIRSQYGIADVLAHKGAVDQHLIQSSAYSYMQDYHVLASPAGIEAPRTNSLRYENLAPACEACRDV
ncbi:MAG: AAA family ATPase, partial [Planctomycetota bacterium]